MPLTWHDKVVSPGLMLKPLVGIFSRVHFVEHSRSVLAAIEEYRSQVQAQLDYVVHFSSRTSDCASYAGRAGIIPLKYRFCKRKGRRSSGRLSFILSPRILSARHAQEWTGNQ